MGNIIFSRVIDVIAVTSTVISTRLQLESAAKQHAENIRHANIHHDHNMEAIKRGNMGESKRDETGTMAETSRNKVSTLSGLVSLFFTSLMQGAIGLYAFINYHHLYGVIFVLMQLIPICLYTTCIRILSHLNGIIDWFIIQIRPNAFSAGNNGKLVGIKIIHNGVEFIHTDPFEYIKMIYPKLMYFMNIFLIFAVFLQVTSFIYIFAVGDPTPYKCGTLTLICIIVVTHMMVNFMITEANKFKDATTVSVLMSEWELFEPTIYRAKTVIYVDDIPI